VYGNLGRRVMRPAGFQLASGHGRTFPAAAPLRRLDRVFFRGGVQACGAFVGHTALARRASDHLPLIVDFEIPEARSAVSDLRSARDESNGSG
jgi:endonuclease/exonuclease/phosphatase family metal-dependent hydrolase